MLNTFAKLLLVSTSLAPILGAVGVNQISRGLVWSSWWGWFAAAGLLVFLCWAMLRFALQICQKQSVRVEEFERSDKEVLAFLLAYLLPFISGENLAFTENWLTGAYILALIFLVVANAGVIHFNPVMGLLGYHFYLVRDSGGQSCLLISKVDLRRVGQDIQTVRLAQNIYLRRENQSAE